MIVKPFPNINCTKISVTGTATNLFDLIKTAGSLTSDLFGNHETAVDALDITIGSADVVAGWGGLTPTATEGDPLESSSIYRFRGRDLKNLKLIRTGGSNVTCYVSYGYSEEGESESVSQAGGGASGGATEAKQDDQITIETAIQTAVQVMDDWDESDRAKVNPVVGQAGVQGGSGAVSANTQRVVLASDVGLPAGTNNIGDVDLLSFPAVTEAAGTIDALNEEVVLTLGNGEGTATIFAAGTFTGTLTLQVSIDGITFATVAYGTNYSTLVQTLTSTSGMKVSVAGWKAVKMIATAWTSGSVDVTIRGTVASDVMLLGASIPQGTNYIGKVRQTDGTNDLTLANAAVSSSAYAIPTREVPSLLTASTPSFATVGTSSGSAVASNGSRRVIYLKNTSANAISLAFAAGTAILNSGITLAAGEAVTLDVDVTGTGAIHAIAGGASSNLAVQEFTV